uniref:t-SNARE coiled-coil homology domain-containing protein n=1 Tax=Chromera velia CCMP2878 TaxID=1169474 RepID=A0A0G4HCT2_9ALVE|eukprot:Cvel_26150.t1-p1 / transcript=Cvel_26150.t1 / gene=Cvel_26150 / organism=Chromera_velia_CCMP2878 / gene_product=hypothetical protein / transcript_product=hypothetical protein / location=Cvel_scaffold3067:11125-16671(-) / protein_length=500 / sequence_SO=supercontig / SO=protein_coding / is_pseudo=false
MPEANESPFGCSDVTPVFQDLCRDKAAFPNVDPPSLPASRFMGASSRLANSLRNVQQLIERNPASSWIPRDNTIEAAKSLVHEVDAEIRSLEGAVSDLSGLVFPSVCFRDPSSVGNLEGKALNLSGGGADLRALSVSLPPLLPGSVLLKRGRAPEVRGNNDDAETGEKLERKLGLQTGVAASLLRHRAQILSHLWAQLKEVAETLRSRELMLLEERKEAERYFTGPPYDGPPLFVQSVAAGVGEEASSSGTAGAREGGKVLRVPASLIFGSSQSAELPPLLFLPSGSPAPTDVQLPPSGFRKHRKRIRALAESGRHQRGSANDEATPSPNSIRQAVRRSGTEEGNSGRAGQPSDFVLPPSDTSPQPQQARRRINKTRTANGASPEFSGAPVADAFPGGGMETETAMLMANIETDILAVRATQRQVQEISGLLETFSHRVTEQAEIADRVLDHAEQATELVVEAGKQLVQARERTGSYRLHMMLFFIGGGLFLLLVDWLKS